MINGTRKFLGTSPADKRAHCALESSKQLSAILIFDGRDISRRSDGHFASSDIFFVFFFSEEDFFLSFLVTLHDERERPDLNHR